jgi:hypothetical protein
VEAVYWRAALSCQHMGRSPDPGFPRELLPYVDSLVYSYRLSPVTAVLLVEQLKKVDREIEGRRANVGRLRRLLADSRVIAFPVYRPGDVPSYYTLSMNFDAEAAGVRRETFIQALAAERVEAGGYVPAPIPHWERLRGASYRGPRTLWTEYLAALGVNYRSQEFPGCAAKIRKSIDMDWNYIRRLPGRMERLADAFLKIEENLPALRDWERRAAGRAAASPARTPRPRPVRRQVL